MPCVPYVHPFAVSTLPNSVIPPALSEAEGTGESAPFADSQWRDRGWLYKPASLPKL
jgi:hypothetical protein